MGKWSAKARAAQSARMKERFKHKKNRVGDSRVEIKPSMNGMSLTAEIDQCIESLYTLKRRIVGIAENIGNQ